MPTRYLALIAISILSAALPACGQLSDAQIVANAYPSELSADQDATTRFSTFVAAGFGGGQTLLIALYTNGTRASLSVLNRGGQVLSQSDMRSLKGFKGELEIVDVDGDGVPEIVARLYSGHGENIPDTWIYAWRGGQLTLISPTQRVHALDITLLSQIALVDLDGTGKLAILAFPGVRRDDSGNRVANGDGIVYTLASGQYAATPLRFTYAQPFLRHTGSPDPVIKHFAASPGQATLRIVNGSAPGGLAVDSARVILNGTTIAAPSSFKPQTRTLTIPVQLAAENTLSVELAGKPGAGIWIIVAGPTNP
ncbi:MAG TPA: VCBS repeat-containing protein [Thermoanaerobaculia bacterium]|nr:VCBS repeat-containing protein [Thermoanaerobaculia bacterium]